MLKCVFNTRLIYLNLLLCVSIMANQNFYNNSYLSIEDILATNEQVTCKLQYDLPKLGFLDPSCSENDLKSGSSVELPFWLADALSSKVPPLLSIGLPKVYREAYKDIIEADATAVDFQKLGMYYYDFGCHIAKYDARRSVGLLLDMAFRNRFRLVMDLCSAGTVKVCDVSKLTRREVYILRIMQAAVQLLSDWLKVGAGAMTHMTAPMVAAHKKRKRAEMEI